MLRIVRGTPSDEEFAAASPRSATDIPLPRGSVWAAPTARLRTPLHPGLDFSPGGGLVS